MASLKTNSEFCIFFREAFSESQTFCSSIRKYRMCSVVQEMHSAEIHAALITDFIRMSIFQPLKFLTICFSKMKSILQRCKDAIVQHSTHCKQSTALLSSMRPCRLSVSSGHHLPWSSSFLNGTESLPDPSTLQKAIGRHIYIYV